MLKKATFGICSAWVNFLAKDSIQEIALIQVQCLRNESKLSDGKWKDEPGCQYSWIDGTGLI